jgi:hypothetical protein
MTRQSDPINATPEAVAGPPRAARLPGQRLSLCDSSAAGTLQRSLRAPGEARAFVAEHSCSEHGPSASAAVQLVASEVVLHAVRSCVGPIIIALRCELTSVTLSVRCSMDAPQSAPRLQLGDLISSMIVDSICRASGTIPTEHGLTMWCSLPTGHVPLVAPPAGRAVGAVGAISSRPMGSG